MTSVELLNRLEIIGILATVAATVFFATCKLIRGNKSHTDIMKEWTDSKEEEDKSDTTTKRRPSNKYVRKGRTNEPGNEKHR